MKISITSVTLLLSLTMAGSFGCSKKDAGGDKPAASDKPAATDKAAPPVALPPACKQFTDAFETLTKCEKLPLAGRTEMKAGYQKMLDAMIKLGDVKAMSEGCEQGMVSLKLALSTAGC